MTRYRRSFSSQETIYDDRRANDIRPTTGSPLLHALLLLPAPPAAARGGLFTRLIQLQRASPVRPVAGNVAGPHSRANVACRQPFSLPVGCHAQNACAYADWRARYALGAYRRAKIDPAVHARASFVASESPGKVFDPARLRNSEALRLPSVCTRRY